MKNNQNKLLNTKRQGGYMKMMVNSVETLQKKIAQVRAAQEQFAKFTQEQVDEIFFQVSMAANQARIQLAKMAVEETGIGVAEDKVIKNHYASEYIYNAYKDVKTCGIIEKDDAFGITKIAEPIGVLAGIIPTTNPTSTAIFKSLIACKTPVSCVENLSPYVVITLLAEDQIVFILSVML